MMTHCYYSAQTTWSTTDDATQGSTLTSVTGATGPGRTVLRSSTTRRSTMSLWTIWGPSVRVAVILSPCCSQGGDQNSFKIVCKHYHCPILLSATQWANKSKSQVFTCLPSRNSNPSRYKHYQWFSQKKLCFSPSQMFQKHCIYQSQFRWWVWQLFTPRSSWSAKSSESAIRKKKD